MRIERLHIDGFGHFSEYSLGPFDGDIVIFRGPNESGKSTLLSFVQSVLFGFQKNRPGVPAIEPLAGGKHGGRIVAVDEDGLRFTIERHAGAHGGPVTLSMPDGGTGDASDLNRLLGMPAEVYCNVFSFDLHQLFTAGSLNDQNIKTHLYGAGLGTENLLSVLGGLEDRAEEIFLSNRGSKQRVPQLLDELQSVENSLGLARQDAQAYHGHRARLAEIEARRAEIRRDIATARARQQHDTNLLRSLDDWATLRAIEAQLLALPEIESFPEGGIARLDEIETRIASAEAEEYRARQRVGDLQSRVERPLENAVLEDHQLDVEQLRSRLEGFNDWIGNLQRMNLEASAAAQDLQDGLAALGQGWNAERLASFETSIPEQDAVASHDTALERAGQAIRAAEQGVQTATSERQDADARLASARRQFQPGRALGNSHQELEGWERAYREARNARQEYLRRWQHYRDQQAMPPEHAPATGERQSAGMLPAGLIIVGAVLVLAGILAGGTALIVGAAAGGITIAAGAALLLRRPRHAPLVAATRTARLTIQRAQEEYEAGRERLVQALHPFGESDPNRADAVLDDIYERINSTRAALKQVDDAAAEVAMRQQRLDSANERRDQAVSASDEAGAAWREWLAARALPEDLSPKAVTTIFARVSRLREQQERLDELNQQRRELARQVQQYQTRYTTVVEALGERPVGTVHEVGAAVNLIIERYDTLRNELAHRHTLAEQLQAAQRNHQERLAEIDRLRRQHTGLLAHGCTADAEAFRTSARQFAERQEATRSQREILARIQRYSGAGDAWQQFRDELDNASAETLDQRIAERDQRIEAYEEELSGLEREHGEHVAEMERLASDETAVALRAQQQLLQEQLREAADQWSSYTVAREILHRARQRYEEERQPEVLRTAEGHFRTITGGRYTGLINPIGSDDVRVVRSDDRRLEAGQLSRGTREQLYLSLRFGLIDGFGRTAPPLPIIVDDVLVNFDPARARATAEAFTEMSHTNQILVFTCHPSTVEHFRAVSPGVQVVELGREAAVVG